MADDYAGDASTTGRLPIGGSVTATLDPAADVDWFAVSLTAAHLYQFDLTTASNFVRPGATDIGLVDASGVQVAGTGTTDSTFQYKPNTSGTYYLTAKSINFNGYGTGTYTLTAGPEDDFADNASTTGLVAAGRSIAGKLEESNDADWIAISLKKGYNLGFTVTAQADFTRSVYLYVQLRDNNGIVVAGGTVASKTDSYTATADGTYYLNVGGGSGVFGSYIVSTVGDDYSNAPTGAGALGVGASATGTLESPDDHDWFAVSLTAGATYTINLAAFASLTPASNLGVSLKNASGTQTLATGTTTRALTYKPTATGTYYLDVSAGNTTGAYQLNSSATGLPTTPTPTPTSPINGGTAPGLSTSTLPVYRFFDTHFGTHFYTSNSGEKDTILATRPDLSSEGVGLSALGPSSDPNVAAVFRFFDTIHGTQFLTSAASEKDTIIATRSDLRFEGTSFYEYTTNIAGSAPVYRFFDKIYGTHFYTGSEAERATIAATRSDLVAEGVAFYSPTS